MRPDLEELEESVAAIEEAGVSRRLGIDASEVKSRRHFVDRVTEEIKVISSRFTSREASRGLKDCFDCTENPTAAAICQSLSLSGEIRR